MRNYDLDFLKKFSLVILFLAVVTGGLVGLSAWLHKAVPPQESQTALRAQAERIAPVADVYAGSTGAAGNGGFKGLGGLHARNGLLRYGDESATALRMRRRDTGETVDVVFDASTVPPDPEMRTMIPLALAGSPEATDRFGTAWQDRVRRLLLDHADDPALIEVAG